MGSSGSYLKSGGFASQEWEQVGAINGVKILRKIGLKKDATGNLPLYSNTPGTAYILLKPNGRFHQFRQYGEDRKAKFDIDYGRHNSAKPYLHMHTYSGKDRPEPMPITNTKGDIINKSLYEKYKGFLKGIKL